MTTLNLTPQPSTASVLVQVSLTDGGTLTAVMRTDANGTAPVRVQDGQLPSTTSVVVEDNEAATAGEITYRAVVTDGPAATSTTTLPNTDPWLTVPLLPPYSIPVAQVSGYDEARSSHTTVHEPIGRRLPLPTLGVLSGRRGRLELWAADYPAALAIVHVYSLGETVMLRQADHVGLDLYHVVDAGQITVTPHAGTDTRRRWAVTVPYIEVDVPTGPASGTLGWSIDDVLAAHATVAEVAEVYDSVDALTVGPL